MLPFGNMRLFFSIRPWSHPVMSLGDRLCVSRKNVAGGGGWVCKKHVAFSDNMESVQEDTTSGPSANVLCQRHYTQGCQCVRVMHYAGLMQMQ